jgi:hypothetical protein
MKQVGIYVSGRVVITATNTFSWGELALSRLSSVPVYQHQLAKSKKES